MRPSKANALAFLEDLEKITRKHKIAIGGCGCCGSPFLEGISGKMRKINTYNYTIDEKNYDPPLIEKVNWR